MNLYESFKSAASSLKSNKMRSFLTMLGIIIGISSVITIVSIGQGGKNYMTGQFSNIGTNVINVSVKSSNNDIQQGDYLTLKDADLLKEKISSIDAVVPTLQGVASAKTENKSKNVVVAGVTSSYIKLSNMEFDYGRFLNEHDILTNKNVVVIDNLTAIKLFKKTDVVGEKLILKSKMDSINATIIGVIENPEGSFAQMFGDNSPGYAYVPITISDRIMQNTDISRFSIIMKNMTNSEEDASSIVRLLERWHRNSGKYTAEQGFKQLDQINNVLNMFTMIIGAIAGISLIVGGIGVMNIMLVSVTERTREIGIRKSLGAKMRDIRIQFLTESIILCLIGGTIGMILGIIIGIIAGRALKITISVSWLVILISFLFSSTVGIFFGIYPANKAAKLDPIEALRYE